VKVEAPPRFKLSAVVQGTDKNATKALQQLTERFLKKVDEKIELHLSEKQFQRLLPKRRKAIACR